MRLVRLLLALVLLLAGAGCGQSPSAQAVRTTSTCPAGSHSTVDWVGFVRHAGVQYESTWPAAMVPEDQLGPVVRTVTCTRSRSALSPDEPARDGDAGHLPVGTQLRTLTGVDPTLRLAVRVASGWQVYDAHDVPTASSGAELLDLRQVVRVSLVESQDGTDVVRSVSAAPDVAHLVAAVAAAPLVPPSEVQRGVRGAQWFVRFELAQGPPVQRAWYPEGDLLLPRIVAPPVLQELLLG